MPVVPDLTLRVATPADVSSLVALVHAAYRDADRSGWTTEAPILGGQRIDERMLSELIADPDAAIVVTSTHCSAGGTSAGDIVACGALRHAAGAPTASFGLFAVDPDHQGCGIGGHLLAHVEERAAARGATQLRLEVIHTRHELLGWYRRRGYQPTGETAPFPYGDERFGVPKRDDLHFVVLERTLSPPTPT
jgi:ribosomal protein S18 acetylase RimI-like enzyme